MKGRFVHQNYGSSTQKSAKSTFVLSSQLSAKVLWREHGRLFFLTSKQKIQYHILISVEWERNANDHSSRRWVSLCDSSHFLFVRRVSPAEAFLHCAAFCIVMSPPANWYSAGAQVGTRLRLPSLLLIYPPSPGDQQTCSTETRSRFSYQLHFWHTQHFNQVSWCYYPQRCLLPSSPSLSEHLVTRVDEAALNGIQSSWPRRIASVINHSVLGGETNSLLMHSGSPSTLQYSGGCLIWYRHTSIHLSIDLFTSVFILYIILKRWSEYSLLRFNSVFWVYSI